MNNEPVAWMVDGVLFNSLGAALNISFDIEQPCIPLYTHPAKTLTNEEIKTIFYETGDLFDFARAILKKAREMTMADWLIFAIRFLALIIAVMCIALIIEFKDI